MKPQFLYLGLNEAAINLILGTSTILICMSEGGGIKPHSRQGCNSCA